MTTSEISRYPLCWPDSVARRPGHMRGRPAFTFGTVADETSRLLAEVNRLNEYRWSYRDTRVIVSTNIRLRLDGLPLSTERAPDDPAVAIYFTLDIRRGGKLIHRPCVMTCDRWQFVPANLSAIKRDIEAQRARMRYGATSLEQAFRGYLAIPERCGGLAWWQELDVPSNATPDQVRAAFKLKAKSHHPDAGGDPQKWARLQEAFDQAIGQIT